MKIHVAYRTDSIGVGMRCSGGSVTTLRKRISQVLDSDWSIYHYKVTPNVATVCQFIEDITKIPFDGEPDKVRVTEHGQVRKVV